MEETRNTLSIIKSPNCLIICSAELSVVDEIVMRLTILLKFDEVEVCTPIATRTHSRLINSQPPIQFTVVVTLYIPSILHLLWCSMIMISTYLDIPWLIRM